jgi:enhancing lycopene biosynthesis protein 2
MKPIGIFLSGCGYQNGTDIWEAVLLYYFLEQRKMKTVFFSSPPFNPLKSSSSEDKPLNHQNFFSKTSMLARGNLKELKETGSDTLSALILAGGEGILKNFTQSEEKNPVLKVDPELKKFVREIYRRKKPIAACGVAAVVIASCLKDLVDSPLTLTSGNDPELSSQLEKMGVNHVITKASEAVIDSENQLVTTPGSQIKANISDLGTGLNNLIDGILELTK